jgi:hypothetical protein
VSQQRWKDRRFVAVLLLRHLAAAEFSENRDRLFAIVEPIDTQTWIHQIYGQLIALS